MKKCTGCNTIKPLEEFGNNKSKRDGKQTHCKECRVKYNHDHYEKTKHSWAESRRQSSIKNRRKNQKYLESYLYDHPCVDCGESDIRVLEFDHIADDKLSEVTIMVDHSLAKMISEISKCEVRCSNCHRKITHERLGQTSWRQRSYQRTLSAK